MVRKCLFCNKEQEGIFSREWKTNICIFLNDVLVREVTVCPLCRNKKTIQEMYEEAAKNE